MQVWILFQYHFIIHLTELECAKWGPHETWHAKTPRIVFQISYSINNIKKKTHPNLWVLCWWFFYKGQRGPATLLASPQKWAGFVRLPNHPWSHLEDWQHQPGGRATNKCHCSELVSICSVTSPPPGLFFFFFGKMASNKPMFTLSAHIHTYSEGHTIWTKVPLSQWVTNSLCVCLLVKGTPTTTTTMNLFVKHKPALPSTS